MVMKKRKKSTTRKTKTKTAKKRPARRKTAKKAGKTKKTARKTKSRGRKKAAGKKKVSKGRKPKKVSKKRAKSRGASKKKARSSSNRSRSKLTLKEKVARSTDGERATSKQSGKVAKSGDVFEIKSFLDKNDVKYDLIQHTPAYTAQQVAASAHVSGRDFAKTVIVKVDGKFVMVVEAAHTKVDLEALKRELHAMNVEIAREIEFRDKFPQCELGAMPPFGNFYGMDVYIGESLTHEKDIAFNAGSHSELVRIAYKDFQRLVHPKVIRA